MSRLPLGGHVTAGQLRGLLDGSAGRWGRRRVRRAFDHVDARSESPRESWVRMACALGGLPAPVPQYDVVYHGTWLARGDLAWPEARVLVEYDGEHHVDGFGDRQGRRTPRWSRRCGLDGPPAVRRDLRSMDDVVRRIGQALGVVPLFARRALAVSAEIAGRCPPDADLSTVLWVAQRPSGPRRAWRTGHPYR